MTTYHEVRSRFHYDPLTGHLISQIIGRRVGFVVFKRGRPSCRKVNISKQERLNEANVIWLWMTGAWPPHEVDHIDLDPTNNRWHNLRLADDNTNAFNRRKFGGSKYKWVQEVAMRSGPSRYRARVTAYGVRESSMYYDTPEEAHAAAIVIATKLHGQFARSN